MTNGQKDTKVPVQVNMQVYKSHYLYLMRWATETVTWV